MLDLFGNERPEPQKPAEPVFAPSLIDAAAERLALESGRPRSQELSEILFPQTDEKRLEYLKWIAEQMARATGLDT